MHKERKVLLTKLGFNLQLDFVQKVLRDKFQFLVPISKKSEKLKIDIDIVPLFFQMSDLLVPKIEIYLKYFLEKKSKSSHCDMYEVKSNFELQQVHRTKI